MEKYVDGVKIIFILVLLKVLPVFTEDLIDVNQRMLFLL